MNDPASVSGAFGWMDGEVLPVDALRVSAFDRTLLYGLGAFETVRLFGGRAYLLDRHLDRLARSLDAVGLAVPPAVDALEAGLDALVARNGTPDCLARITVTAGSASRADDRHVLIALRDLPTRPARVEIGVAEFAHDTRSPLVGVKSTSYLVHYLLRERAEAEGRTDDLMVDPAGHITEATVANVFAVRDGRLVTPPLSEGILAGVTRGRVLELAAGAGLPIAEEALPRDALVTVDELFLTGAGKCVLPVDVVDGRTLPSERPVTGALLDAMAADVARACGLPREDVVF